METRPDLLIWIEDWIAGNPPENVWLGISVCNQAEADRDIPKLLTVPAAVRFLSIEPMLGAISLDCWPIYGDDERPLLHWIICGGESGPKARPMHPGWVRSLRDQCAEAGVPFLFKQWGEFAPNERSFAEINQSSRKLVIVPIDYEKVYPAAAMDRVGVKAAGRLLDGREHNNFPGDAA